MSLLPKEAISFSVEVYRNKIGVKSRTIYLTTILIVIIITASLPLIYIDINVSGNGIIRSDQQRIELYSPVSGRIDNFYVRENQTLVKGQEILSIYPDVLLQKENFTISQIKYIKEQRAQAYELLKQLRILDIQKIIPVFTSYYNSQLATIQELIYELDLQISAEQLIFDRQKQLYDQQVISISEIEKYEHQLRSVKAKKQFEIKSQLSKLEGEKRKYKEQLDQLEATLNEIQEEKLRYTIKSPTDGTLMNLLNGGKDSFVSINQRLGEISPNSEKIVECYISPSDIGMLKVGQAIRFKVDAYNYNEWGFVEGKVKEISQDIHFGEQDSKPYFLIKCQLGNDWLQMQNGYKGHLKKGMTVQGRFFVARRSIYQLLFDKTDDWINPANS